MTLAFTIKGVEHVCLGWQSDSQMYYAEVKVYGNKAYLGEPDIMYFREFIDGIKEGHVKISETSPIL